MARLSADGQEILAATFFGGSRQERDVDYDAFILKPKADGSALAWSTRFGGRSWDGIMGVQVDLAGAVYIAGHTQSDDFPITAGAPQPRFGGKSDCFLASLSTDARMRRYSALYS